MIFFLTAINLSSDKCRLQEHFYHHNYLGTFVFFFVLSEHLSNFFFLSLVLQPLPPRPNEQWSTVWDLTCTFYLEYKLFSPNNLKCLFLNLQSWLAWKILSFIFWTVCLLKSSEFFDALSTMSSRVSPIDRPKWIHLKFEINHFTPQIPSPLAKRGHRICPWQQKDLVMFVIYFKVCFIENWRTLCWT